MSPRKYHHSDGHSDTLVALEIPMQRKVLVRMAYVLDEAQQRHQKQPVGVGHYGDYVDALQL